MNKDKPFGSPGQNQSDPQTHKGHPAAASKRLKPNCDIFGIRAVFDALETDFEHLLERKFQRLKALDARLGSQDVFDEKRGLASKIHRQREALKNEMDVLFAFRDYLESLTTFALESWAALSEAYADERRKMEQEIEALRADHRQALDDQIAILTMWNSDLKRQNASRA